MEAPTDAGGGRGGPLGLSFGYNCSTNQTVFVRSQFAMEILSGIQSVALQIERDTYRPSELGNLFTLLC